MRGRKRAEANRPNPISFHKGAFKQATANRLLVETIVCDNLPLNIADRLHFRRFLTYLCPEFKHSSPQTLKRLLMKLYAVEHKKVVQMIKGTPSEVFGI